MKSPKLLTWLGKNKSKHYSALYIRKKGSGKLRELQNPDSLVRAVQYRILTRILDKVPIPPYIHAFERAKSIPEMAKVHVGKDVVISLDIKDFFTSIKQTRLANLFQVMGFDSKPARTLSELCTYKAYVPQGGLTSPKVSNIVAANTFGPEIQEYCNANKLALTIYADDITVSFTGVRPVGPILVDLTNLVQKHRFRVNTKKTKVMTKKRRQYVCGVVVNERTNLIREERKRLRAIVHNIVKNGIEAEAAKNQVTPQKFAEIIRGKVNWLSQLNKPLGEKLMSKLSAYLTPWLEEQRSKVTVTSPDSSLDTETLTEGVALTVPWEG